MVFIYRIVLDSKQDVYRDIAINSSGNLEDLHKAITSSFSITDNQMASFYKSNKNWEQGEEYTLLETEESKYAFLMKGGILRNITPKKNDRLIYVFDFFLMWTFFVELVDIQEIFEEHLPSVITKVGNMPENSIDPNLKFSKYEKPQTDEFKNLSDEEYYL